MRRAGTGDRAMTAWHAQLREVANPVQYAAAALRSCCLLQSNGNQVPVRKAAYQPPRPWQTILASVVRGLGTGYRGTSRRTQ